MKFSQIVKTLLVKSCSDKTKIIMTSHVFIFISKKRSKTSNIFICVVLFRKINLRQFFLLANLNPR